MPEDMKKNAHIDIVFEGPGPADGPTPRFIEVEVDGRSISIGKWMTRPDGLQALRITREDLQRLEDMPFMD